MKRTFIFSLIVLGGLMAACTSNRAQPLPAPAIEQPVSNAGQDGESSSGDIFTCSFAQVEAVKISTAKLFVEYQSTDGDLGVHGLFDDAGWSELCVYAPNGDLVLSVNPQFQLKDLTMASLFFESREPVLADFSFEDLKTNFPEGDYVVRSLSFDGSVLAGTAAFSHNFPGPPEIINPPPIEDEESAGEVLVSPSNLVIDWQEVTESVDGRPVAISSYQVIITKVDHNDRHGFSRPVFDVHLPPDRTSLSVPVEFLEPDTVYELEVLALEESRNQTITVGSFTTAA